MQSLGVTCHVPDIRSELQRRHARKASPLQPDTYLELTEHCHSVVNLLGRCNLNGKKLDAGDVRIVCVDGNLPGHGAPTNKAARGINTLEQQVRGSAHQHTVLWQAAHNTDYYITKYVTKTFEPLQNLIGPFALGLRRLEQEEELDEAAAHAAVLENPWSYKRRARRVTLRLAMAANRATWTSCCEMALYIRTGAHVRKTYSPRPIYLSRLAYMSYACQRLLDSEDKFVLQAVDLAHEATTNVTTINFIQQPYEDDDNNASPSRQRARERCNAQTNASPLV